MSVPAKQCDSIDLGGARQRISNATTLAAVGLHSATHPRSMLAWHPCRERGSCDRLNRHVSRKSQVLRGQSGGDSEDWNQFTKLRCEKTGIPVAPRIAAA